MSIARVVPRRTRATPTDALAFIGEPPMFLPPISEVHVSVTFTWDLPEAERLVRAWEARDVAPVYLGGPATGKRSEAFTPALYLRSGYTITSRGCPNRCWFCQVPKREGEVRELPIMDGFNVLDDNLLACSEIHIRAVFAMLSRQPQKPIFSGGLEAKRLRDWQVYAIMALHTTSAHLAYDTPDDWEPLVAAVEMFTRAQYRRWERLACYVLIGSPGDTVAAAERRLLAVCGLGLRPMAMLYRDDKNQRPDIEWRRFQRLWVRPTIVGKHVRRKVTA